MILLDPWDPMPISLSFYFCCAHYRFLGCPNLLLRCRLQVCPSAHPSRCRDCRAINTWESSCSFHSYSWTLCSFEIVGLDRQNQWTASCPYRIYLHLIAKDDGTKRHFLLIWSEEIEKLHQLVISYSLSYLYSSIIFWRSRAFHHCARRIHRKAWKSRMFQIPIRVKWVQ